MISQELYQEPFYLAVPAGHHLTQHKAVSQHQLTDQQLLLLDDGHCLREQALEVCKLLGAAEQQNFRATSLETLRQMVSIGCGITLIPQMAIRNEDKQIVYLPFADPQPVRHIGLVWRASSIDKVLFNELAVVIRKNLK